MAKIWMFCVVMMTGSVWAEDCFHRKVNTFLTNSCTCNQQESLIQANCEIRILTNPPFRYPYSAFDLIFLHLNMSSQHDNSTCLKLNSMAIRKTNKDTLVMSNATTLLMEPFMALVFSILVEEEVDIMFTHQLVVGRVIQPGPQCRVSLRNFVPPTDILKLEDAIANIFNEIRDIFRGSVATRAVLTFAETIKTLPAPYSEQLNGASIKHLAIRNSHVEILYENSTPVLYSLRHLEISNCQVTHVDRGAFKGIPAVEILSLSKNKLSSIPDDVFTLPSLVELDLSGNNPPQVFQLHPGKFNQSLPRTEVIHLNRTRISSLPSRAFRSFPELKRLYLSECSISTIEISAFESLPFLQVLDLSQNKISSLSGKIFTTVSTLGTRDSFLLSLQHLEIVNLSHNSISKLFPGDFDDVTAVEVDLQWNIIDMWTPSAFRNMKRLKSLNLANNRIRSLPNISHSLGQNASLNFHSNPFHCACPRTSFQYSDLVIAQCATPISLKGKDLRDFECNGKQKKIRNTSLMVSIQILILFIKI